MKKILVPVDFTETGNNAVDYAIHLAEKLDADIHLFHSVDDPFFTEASGNFVPGTPVDFPSDNLYKVRTEAQNSLDKLLATAEFKLRDRKISGVTLSSALNDGLPVDEILHEAARYQPQLILMGSHGHSKLDRVFFGTVTQGIIREAHFPVLAIPAGYTYKEVKEIVYMTDLLDEDIYSISKLINLFKPFEIKLHITHFNLGDEKEQEEEKLFTLNEQLINDHKDVKIDYEIIDASILRDAYKQYIESKNIDLISLTTRKLGGFKRFFNSGTAIDALYHSNLPLLVFHRE